MPAALKISAAFADITKKLPARPQVKPKREVSESKNSTRIVGGVFLRIYIPVSLARYRLHLYVELLYVGFQAVYKCREFIAAMNAELAVNILCMVFNGVLG